MKIRNHAGAAVLAGMLMTGFGAPALAQGLDLKGALGGLGGLGGGSGADASALSAGSLGNAAGILEYCIKNKYLPDGSASSLKDQLMSKLGGSTGQAPQKDSGYLSGAKGILQTGTGNSVDLGGSGLKAAMAEQACDAVMQQAKSFL
ncbi:DUF2501 domain-containing protein [Bordetella genomosp. 11]|uniref:DUF2501 domain-containing protein n=1 Tax=Bordetella genomosp. 11 TaxID=1416808 RepID=A0A261UK44_9BORD|nr:DUF2501 domain-containing protein [Bordetella genomosp. 11]OZI62269.1 hypothetical protein CAL28_24000 [Bordetella genomosp. 11]